MAAPDRAADCGHAAASPLRCRTCQLCYAMPHLPPCKSPAPAAALHATLSQRLPLPPLAAPYSKLSRGCCTRAAMPAEQ
jgi:hypothetical protein